MNADRLAPEKCPYHTLLSEMKNKKLGRGEKSNSKCKVNKVEISQSYTGVGLNQVVWATKPHLGEELGGNEVGRI